MNPQAQDRSNRQAMPRPMPRLSRLAEERAKSSHDQIAAILGTELLKGVYPPGGNMPAEPDLIARFQVSRTVMREVMKTLAAKGFVISKTRVGTRVRDPVYWNYFDADVLAWRVRLGLDDEFMKSLTEVRRSLEPAAAALAAKRRSPTDIARLRECVRQMARTDHTRQSFAEADLETALVASFAHSSPVDDPEDHEATVNGHAAIVDAIEAGEERAAAEAILKVINIGVTRIDVTRKKQRGTKK
jgi:DNA-binding FadR family transcriptional regulator